MRELAISFGTSFNTIGIAFGFILPTFFVGSEIKDFDQSRKEIEFSLLVQGAIAVFLMLLALFSFQNKPEMAPSPNAAVERDDALCRSYWKLLRNLDFLKLTACFSIYFSVVIVLSTVIDKLSVKHGFTTDDSGFFGTINVVGGFIGTF